MGVTAWAVGRPEDASSRVVFLFSVCLSNDLRSEIRNFSSIYYVWGHFRTLYAILHVLESVISHLSAIVRSEYSVEKSCSPF